MKQKKQQDKNLLKTNETFIKTKPLMVLCFQKLLVSCESVALNPSAVDQLVLGRRRKTKT